jgi:hypothetical protein
MSRAPLKEIPIELLAKLPEYRNPSWLAAVPRELIKTTELKTWELFHPVQIWKIPGWEDVATRLWANILALEANYDDKLASLLGKHGSIPVDREILGAFAEILYDAYRGVAFFAGFQNEQNFFRSCWTTSTHAVLVEEVGSMTKGKNGGWGLTKALIDKLIPFSRRQRRPIHSTAVSPESERLLMHYGFSRFTARLSPKPHIFRSHLILYP